MPDPGIRRELAMPGGGPSAMETTGFRCIITNDYIYFRFVAFVNCHILAGRAARRERFCIQLHLHPTAARDGAQFRSAEPAEGKPSEWEVEECSRED
jgi:hypothetical protein